MAQPPKDAPPKKKVKLSTAWRETRELLFEHKKRLALGLVLMLLSRGAGLAMPWTSKVLIDDVIGNQRSDLLTPLAVLAAVAAIVQAVTSYALSQLLGVAGQGAINDLRKSIHAHVLRLPTRYFDTTQTGALISRIQSDADGIRNLVGTGIVQLVGGTVTAVCAFVILLFLNWKLTLMLVAVIAGFGVCMAYAFRKIRPIFRERGKINAEVTGRLAETLGGIRVVKAYVAEDHEQGVYASGADRLFQNVAKSMKGVSMTGAMSLVALGVISVIMIVAGGQAMTTHHEALVDGKLQMVPDMTLGDFMTFMLYIGLVAAPVIQIASIGTQITEAFAGLDRIREIRGMATEDAEDAAREACPSIRGEVKFSGVTFEYNPGQPVLKDVSLNAPAGTTTALVGSSGSGKSTLVSLIMAFNRPKTGKIFIDGKDLDTLKLHDFRSHLGVVLQENFLFDGTVAENIAFSRPDAKPEEIRNAGRIAHCDEFVLKMEKGYETVVGERGVRLSGGQRQRLAIARALLADPTILILDEATSSLDSETEAMIQDGLLQLRKNRTTFVIAHRLSTIRSSDQIVVLEAGEIVERGTHQELLAKNGRYRELYDRQYHFEHERFINPGEDFSSVPSPLGGEGRASKARPG